MTTLLSSPPASYNIVSELLAPLLETAQESESLIASQHPVLIGNQRIEIPKFMLLGARGGGKPIRLALFAGLDAGLPESIIALARLLLEFELNPALARDYALFAYPVVNLPGFDENPLPLRAFEGRYRKETSDADVDFFKGELRKWFFDGMITLRTDLNAEGFYATVRSEVLAREVVEPAVATAGKTIPLHESPIRIRPSDRHSRLSDYVQGRLAPPADIRPYPFEIELFAPGRLPIEDRVRGLFVAVHEILRHYRDMISHAQNL
ncbi:MAG: peptidase [Chthoniobacteraceae bacterium]|nr:peptidase [Chthoniobacteraceae bacterium]